MQATRGGSRDGIVILRVRGNCPKDLLEERGVSVQREFLNLPSATLDFGSDDGKISRRIDVEINKTHSAERVMVLPAEKRMTVSKCFRTDGQRAQTLSPRQTRTGPADSSWNLISSAFQCFCKPNSFALSSSLDTSSPPTVALTSNANVLLNLVLNRSTGPGPILN